MKIIKIKPFIYLAVVGLLFTLKISCGEQDYHSILDLQEILDDSSNLNNEYSLLEKSNSRKIKNKFNSHLKLPLRNNTNSGNKTNPGNKTRAGNISAIISKAPFKLSECDQILMFPAKRIFPENDYGKKVDAFFTMNALLLNTFEKKDSSKLVKSMKLRNINKAPTVLQGSKNCLYFEDTAARTNTTVCIEDAKQSQDIIKSFNFLKKCIKQKPKPIKAKKKNNNKRKKSNKQIKKFFRTIENPKQKIYDIPKVRQELIKELKKKGIKAAMNVKGKKHDDRARNAKLIKDSKKGKKKPKVPGTP